MSATEHIADLDAALAEDGEDVILRRTTGTVNPVHVDVKCRAFVRSARAEEMVQGSGMSQTQIRVTLSPTAITRAQWPGGQPPTAAVVPGGPEDPSVPRIGDALFVKGRKRAIYFVDAIHVGADLVRINITAQG